MLDRLDTRKLEELRLVRCCAASARVAKVCVAPLWAELKTSATVSRAHTRGPGDVGHETDVWAEGVGRPGLLRLDFVAPGILRVRYAEGAQVPENATPMLADLPDGSRVIGPIEEEGDNRVVITTDEALVTITLDPLGIAVQNAAGHPVALIGGPEKNHFCAWDAFNTGVCRTVPEGRPLATENFTLRPHEAIYGFGEKFIGLNKVGQTIDLNMLEALGTTTPRSYKNVPLFVSTAGYGVFFNHSCRITAWVGSRCAPDLQVALEDDFLDYFVIVGDIPTILDRYTRLTGKPGLPPRWSFGFWQSKFSYSSAEETLEIARRMRAERLPFDVLHLDTHWYRRDWFCDLEFDRERFPDPASYFEEMARHGVKVSLWQLPYIPKGSQLFDDLAGVDGFVRNGEGKIYDVGICYTPDWEQEGPVGCIDVTNPQAVAVYQRYLRRLFDLGARAIKADFGEEAPLDGVYHDGTPGHRAHNLYPLLYNRAVFEETERATGDGVIWARSAWAGSQRYPLHWGGDSSANWHNMVPQMAGGLSLGLSGFPFWSQDIGGFVFDTKPLLLVRWMQIGLFLSHSRVHGFGTREIYRFDQETVRICREFLNLRYRLLPYLWGSARLCATRSLPLARALVVEFQDDPATWNIADQWLLGDALLVAPIVDETNARCVYLPAGVWYDWWTGQRWDGNRWIDIEAPLDRLPLWVREGHVVPLGPVMQYVDERPIDGITVRVAPFTADGQIAFTFPIDDDPAHDLTILYSAHQGRHEVSIEPESLPFEVDFLEKIVPS